MMRRGRRWGAVTIAVLAFATFVGGGVASGQGGIKDPVGDDGQDRQVAALDGLVIQTDFVGPADDGQVPDDLENATVVYYRGTATGPAVVWVSDSAATVLLNGSEVTPRWSGRLSSSDIADVTAFIVATEPGDNTLADGHYDYDCYAIAYTPDVTEEYVWGYGKHVCSGDDVKEFRVKTYLDNYFPPWRQRWNQTSRWVSPPINSVGRSAKYPQCSPQSGWQEWRTRARGSVRFNDGVGLDVEIDTSDSGEGPCL